MRYAIAAVVVACAMVIPASPAAAATGGVEISSDGVTYSSTYPHSLFDSALRFVPGDGAQQIFYVRNSGSEPGHLRITLRDVVAADADFADVLTVSASTVGHSGIPATLLEADPCWVLLEGQTVAAGQVVRVTTRLAVGNLHGQAGQGASAALSLGVTLSSTAVPLPPTDCGHGDLVVPVVPQEPARPAGTVIPALPPAVGTADSPGSSASADPPAEDADLPVLGLPNLLGIDPNTWRLFEEYLVLLLIGAFAVGSTWFAVVAWRRRANDASVTPEQDGAAG